MKPYTTYYYQFNVCNSNNKSPLGRTKTTPNADDDITEVGIAVYSCANYPFGFFNAYGNVARKVRLADRPGHYHVLIHITTGLG